MQLIKSLTSQNTQGRGRIGNDACFDITTTLQSYDIKSTDIQTTFQNLFIMTKIAYFRIQTTVEARHKVYD